MINQQASSSNSTNDMVTVSGNNTARNLFWAPADPRAGDDTELPPLPLYIYVFSWYIYDGYTLVQLDQKSV